MTRESLLLLGAWGLWCVLHSLLITHATARFLRARLGNGFRFHRLGYVLFSALTLVPLAHYSAQLDRVVVLPWEGSYRLLSLAALLVAAGLFLAGGRRYDPGLFLGFRQALSGKDNRSLSASNRLDTSGILAAIRHPWYTATFLVLWFRPLTRLSILVNLVLSAYLVAGTLLEERKLVEEFGDHYRAYQARVSMFVPWKWLASLLQGRRGRL